jgi:hypothetical protein
MTLSECLERAIEGWKHLGVGSVYVSRELKTEAGVVRQTFHRASTGRILLWETLREAERSLTMKRFPFATCWVSRHRSESHAMGRHAGESRRRACAAARRRNGGGRIA